MERFIENVLNETQLDYLDLKSSMERFIAGQKQNSKLTQKYLKSSMERFIVEFFGLLSLFLSI